MSKHLFAKSLLVTTAMATSFAMAQSAGAAEKLKLGVGGYFHAYGVFGSQDDGIGEPGANRRSHKIAREAEIHFKGETTLDNGIKVGVNVQLEAETCADQIDETYIYFQGGFGQLKVGSDDPVSYNLYIGPQNPLPGHGLNDPTFRHPSVGGNAAGTPITRVTISGDSEKISYTSPRLAGFQAGISYTPDRCEEAQTCGGTYAGFQFDNNAGQQSEIVEIGANYIREFNGVNVAISGAYGKGELELAAPGADDRTQWGMAFRVGFSGFRVGAGYKEDDLGTSGSNTDRTDWTIGADYSTGPWRFGIEYWHAEVEAGAGLGDDEADAVEIGVRYTLSPGIILAGGVQYWDLQDNAGAAANENEAIIAIVGTTVQF